MQVQNNKEEVPFAHYEEKFASLDPQEAAARCGVPFENGRFTVTLLGTAYQIAWPKYAISSEDEAAFALRSLPCQTFLLRFLLEGRAAEPSGGYKTFREMPWGEMYIGPYTGRVLTRAAFTFGTRVEKFRAACEKMGALAIPHGDAGFQFDFLAVTGCRSWSTPETKNSRPAARFCTRTTLKPASPPRTASSPAIS